MNVKQLIALSALAFAGSAAMADDITTVNEHFVAQKSRAEVQAELAQARTRGTLQTAGETTAVAPAAEISTLSRYQVRVEARKPAQQRSFGDREAT